MTNLHQVTYSSPNKMVHFLDMGLVPYKKAWDIQEELLMRMVQAKVNAHVAGQEPNSINHLLFCEHSHVYTLGKSGKDNHLLIDAQFLKTIGAEYFASNRGGDITYHGPGQLIAYPIFDLENFFTDIHLYMRSLEEVVIQTCAAFGILAHRMQGLTGVWVHADSVQPAKICAMGVKTSRWVTMHGLALNVNTDLNYFNHIVPCGIQDKSVTSIQKEVGREINLEEVKSKMQKAFADVFGLRYS